MTKFVAVEEAVVPVEENCHNSIRTDDAMSFILSMVKVGCDYDFIKKRYSRMFDAQYSQNYFDRLGRCFKGEQTVGFSTIISCNTALFAVPCV